MTSHPGIDVLVLYEAGELPPEQRAAAAAHLAQCPSCRTALNDFVAADERLRRLPLDPAGNEFSARVMAAVALFPRSRARRLWLVSAASLAAGLAAGAVVTRYLTGTAGTSAGPAAPQFMLLLFERVSERLALAPADRRERNRLMVGWVGDLRASDRFVRGDRLRDEGGRVVTSNAVDDHVGQVGETELLTGCFVIRAADYDDATRAAAACPIVQFGGRVAVRALA